MRLLIVGSSGLVGDRLLQRSLALTAVTEVQVVVRRPLAMRHPKLSQIQADFATIAAKSGELRGDVLCNCLGTTLRNAGSQAAQYQIDCEYPLQMAEIAAQLGFRRAVSVSSVDASPSGNFYLRTKAEMEAGMSKWFPESAFFLRPSFILGDRAEFRLGEKLGIALAVSAGGLLTGSWRRYKPISADRIAQAMLQLALEGHHLPILHFDHMMELSR